MRHISSGKASELRLFLEFTRPFLPPFAWKLVSGESGLFIGGEDAPALVSTFVLAARDLPPTEGDPAGDPRVPAEAAAERAGDPASAMVSTLYSEILARCDDSSC